MAEASQFLHQSLDGRAYWRSVTVLLPDTWPSNCIARPVSGSSGEVPDISVGVPHPVFGNAPWTQQSQGCGQPGDMIYLSYRRLQNIGTYRHCLLPFKNSKKIDFVGEQSEPIYGRRGLQILGYNTLSL
jgi:hypothetical protein